MAKEVRIPVPGGLITHQGVIHEIVLREPSIETYLDLGEIVSIARAPDGTTFWVENGEVLRSYIGKCLVSPRDPLAINQAGLSVGRAVKAAVMGFFRDEPLADAASPTPQTISSSGSIPDDSALTP